MCFDSEGSIIVVDCPNHKIKKITKDRVITIAGSTKGYADGAGPDAKFDLPSGVCLDKDGHYIVADCGNNTIRRVNRFDGTVTTVVSPKGGYLDGPIGEARFMSPFGICSDSHGNIFVSDRGNHKIRKIDVNGTVTTIAGSTEGNAYGIGTEAKFNCPNGVCVNDQGVIVVADGKNHSIKKISPNGVVSTLAGSTAGFADAFAEHAKFNNPYLVAFDGDGSVLVADCSNNRIRKVTQSGVVTTLAGSGRQGLLNGPGLSAEFDSPSGLCYDPSDGSVLVADHNNGVIRKLSFPKKQQRALEAKQNALSESNKQQPNANGSNNSNSDANKQPTATIAVPQTPFKAAQRHAQGEHRADSASSHRLENNLSGSNDPENLALRLDALTKDFSDYKTQVAAQVASLDLQCQRLESQLASVRFRSFSLVSVLLLVHAGLAYCAIFRPDGLNSLKDYLTKLASRD